MNLLTSIKTAAQGRGARLKSSEPSPSEARDRMDAEIPRLRDLAERSRDLATQELARGLQRKAERATRGYTYAIDAILASVEAGQAQAKSAHQTLQVARRAIDDAEARESAARSNLERVTGPASALEAEMATMQQTSRRDHAEAMDAFTSATESDDAKAIERATVQLVEVERRAGAERQQMQVKQRMIDALRAGPIARAQALLDAAIDGVNVGRRALSIAKLDAARVDFDLQVARLLIEAAKCQAAHGEAGEDWLRLSELNLWAFHGERVLAAFGAGPLRVESTLIDNCSLAMSQPTPAEVLAMIEAADLEAAYAALPQPPAEQLPVPIIPGQVGVFTLASDRKHPFTVNGT